MNGLSIKDIQKFFGETHALNGVTFEVAKNEIVALLGPSGCGKSTLLAVIAGLEDSNAGDISWNGASLTGVPSHKRGFGLMFQDYALFPHKNVGANAAFGLEMAGWPQEKIHNRVNETLNIVGLNDYAQRDVNSLSGGEQQRVALARALAPHPKLLMLDEPLGALDRTLRARLLVELGIILRSMQQTALYVTHDQEEAFELADRVVVMNQGDVEQIGTPQEIYRNPASEFVARFLGFSNILQGDIRNGNLELAIGKFEIRDFAAPQQIERLCAISQPVKLPILIRPDAMRLDGSGANQISGIVRGLVFRGSLCRMAVEIKGEVLTFEFPSTIPLPETGRSIELSFNLSEAIQFLS